MRLLRVRPEKGEGRALFRVLGSSGVNYLDLYLQRAGSGKVRVVDCYVFISGETLSQTMRRMYLLAASEADMSLLDRLAGKEREFLKNVPVLKKMQQAQQEKRYGDVIAAYDELPGSLKKERVFLLPRFAAAAALGDDKQYRRAIEDYEKALPDDPSLDLVSVDGHVLRKQYDRALARVDSLDSRVKDPYLQFLRGSILLQKGDRDGAKQRFHMAIAGEPGLPAPYWALIELSMQDKDFRSTAELLTAIERNGGVQLANLEDVPAYADFVKSKEYGPWKARRAKKAR
ncbi:MAG TPA: hypothetical protein VLS93_17840 [Anaeromyxobacteraceae bacterium]|nr:hypothetical protein [Anaeromyxobacteraceae bacterium]